MADENPGVPTPPEVTTDVLPTEVPSVIAGIPVPPEHLKFYTELYRKVQMDAEQRLLIWKTTELQDLEKGMDDKVRDLVAKFWERWKEEQQPPTQEQIQQMVSQEYVTFNVKVFDREQNKEREFTLRELPQKIERKFYRQFQEKMKRYGPEINAFVQAQMGRGFEDQAQAFMKMFDNAFDIIAEAVQIALNPFGKEADITVEWVQDNLSNSRMWNILQAQIEIQRLRDFFSQLYRAGQKVEMMSQPVSFRGLLARAQ